jgi:hypothetical protein
MFIINFLEEEEESLTATSNSLWSLKADEQIMSWSTQQPHDWQIGGKCHAFLWGSGRHGQLGEAGEIIQKQNYVSRVLNKKSGFNARNLFLGKKFEPWNVFYQNFSVGAIF